MKEGRGDWKEKKGRGKEEEEKGRLFVRLSIIYPGPLGWQTYSLNWMQNPQMPDYRDYLTCSLRAGH